MRYFAAISYLGTHYSGWQKQPKAISVQQTIEEALSTLLHQEIKVVGCGRTDTGVHAKGYVLHFDYEESLQEKLVYQLNKVLPQDIVFHRIATMVSDTAHARFDADFRAYAYHLGTDKNPFTTNTVYQYPFFKKLDKAKMQKAANLLLEYQSFLPFCKTNSDTKTMNCELHRSEWVFEESDKMVYHIASNRFLRGMVRLIVGMCLNVGLGKLKIDTVKEALDQQQPLIKSYSAPPHGLFLTDIRYPYQW